MAFTSCDRALALLAELERLTRPVAQAVAEVSAAETKTTDAPAEGVESTQGGDEDDGGFPAEERLVRDRLLERYFEMQEKKATTDPNTTNNAQDATTNQQRGNGDTPSSNNTPTSIVRTYMRTQEPVSEFLAKELLSMNMHPANHHRSDGGPLSASINSSSVHSTLADEAMFQFAQRGGAVQRSGSVGSDHSLAGTAVYNSRFASAATTPMAGLHPPIATQHPFPTTTVPPSNQHGGGARSALEAQLAVAVEEAKADGYKMGFREGGRSAKNDISALQASLAASQGNVARLEGAVESSMRQQDTMGSKLSGMRGDNQRLKNMFDNFSIEDLEKIIDERESVQDERDRLYKLVVRFLPTNIPLPTLGSGFNPEELLATYSASQQASKGVTSNNNNTRKGGGVVSKSQNGGPSRASADAPVDIRRAQAKIAALEDQLASLNRHHMEAFDVMRQQRIHLHSTESDAEVRDSKKIVDKQLGQLFSMLSSRGADSTREFAMVESLHKFTSAMFGTIKGIFMTPETLREIEKHFSAVATHLLPILSRTTVPMVNAGVQGSSTTASMTVDDAKMVVARAAAAVGDLEEHASTLEGSLTRFTQKMQRILRQTLAKRPRNAGAGGVGSRMDMFGDDVVAKQNSFPEVVELMSKTSHVKDLLENCQQILVTNEVLNPNIIDMPSKGGDGAAPEGSALSPTAVAASRRRRNMFKQMAGSTEGGANSTSTDPEKALVDELVAVTGGGDGTGTGILANATSFVPKMGPTGRVTLIFTDIQSSTLLWQLHSDKMRAALRAHNDILRAVMVKYNGYEVKTIGDAFMIAFAEPMDAVNYAMQIQVDLMSQSWEEPFNMATEATMTRVAEESGKAPALSLWNGLRVRVGVHSGTPLSETDCVTRRTDYFGPMVNLSARVQGAALGGQTLISDEVRNNIALGKLDIPCSIRPGGTHHLKGIDRAVELHSILPDTLALREEDFDFQRQMKIDKAAADRKDGKQSEEDPDDARIRREGEAMIERFASGEKELCFVSIFLQRLPELLDHQWEFCISTFYSTFLLCVNQVGGYLSKDNGVNMYQVVFEDPETALRFSVQMQNVCLGLEYGDEISDATDLYAEDNKTLLYRGVSPKIGLHMCLTEGSFDPFANKVLFNKGEASLSTGLALNARMGEVLVSEVLAKEVPIKSLSEFYVRELASPVVVPGVASVYGRLVFAPNLRERLLLRAEFADDVMEEEHKKVSRKNTPPPGEQLRSNSFKKAVTLKKGTQTDPVEPTVVEVEVFRSPSDNQTIASRGSSKNDLRSNSSGTGGGAMASGGADTLFSPVAVPPGCQECGGSVAPVCLKCIKLQCRKCSSQFSLFGKCKQCISSAAVAHYQLAQSMNSTGAITARTTGSDVESRRPSPSLKNLNASSSRRPIRKRNDSQRGPSSNNSLDNSQSPRMDNSARFEKSIDMERSKSNLAQSSSLQRVKSSVSMNQSTTSTTKRSKSKEKAKSKRKQQQEFTKRLYAATASSLHRAAKKEAEALAEAQAQSEKAKHQMAPNHHQSASNLSAPMEKHGSLRHQPNSSLQKGGRRLSSMKLTPLQSNMSPSPSDLSASKPSFRRSRSNNNLLQNPSLMRAGSGSANMPAFSDSDDDEPVAVIPTRGSFHFGANRQQSFSKNSSRQHINSSETTTTTTPGSPPYGTVPSGTQYSHMISGAQPETSPTRTSNPVTRTGSDPANKLRTHPRTSLHPIGTGRRDSHQTDSNNSSNRTQSISHDNGPALMIAPSVSSASRGQAK